MKTASNALPAARALALAGLLLLAGCGARDFPALYHQSPQTQTESPTDADLAASAAGSLASAGTWRHALGAAVEVPQGWETIPTDGSSAFVPPDGRRADGSFRAVTSFIFLPAPGIDRVGQDELVETADHEMGFMAESVRRVGAPEPIALGDRDGLHLGYDTQDQDLLGHVDLYVTLHDGLAVALLSSGEREPVAHHAPTVRAMFESLRFTRPERDRAIVGRWSHSEAYTSGTFSMATETVLELDASGRYSLSSQAAGGDAGASFDTGEDEADLGLWSAANGSLVLRGDDGSLIVYRYRLVDGTLVLDDEAGNRRYFN